ncbi:FadR/GntR family transcriptional regulator [Microbacterium deminutum]|uniref:GntR C-terminal domain-containing protein n=1 Tax=Microbacterium deminutum TaxID=344164 RepID=A0ABN2QM92_9MICO
MTDASDIPALDPRVWGVKPAAPSPSRAEQAASVIEQLAEKAGPTNRIGSKDDLRAVTAVSVGTLNEALALAQARGVVTLRRGPGGGIFAAPKSSLVRMGNSMIGLENDERTVADALRIRNALDPLVIGDALTHSSAADIADLRRITDAMREGIAAGDIDAFLRGSWAYQRRVAEISPSAMLYAVYVNVLGVLDEGTVAVGASTDAAEATHLFDLFDRMSDALAARDRDAAFDVMRDFIASQGPSVEN